MRSIFFCFCFLALLSLTNCGNDSPANDGLNLVSSKSDCNDFTVQNDFSGCAFLSDATTLTVMTWNLRFFPDKGAITQQAVIDILDNLRPDVIAVQEINDISAFVEMVEAMPLYDFEVVDVTGSLDLGFIYNTCEINSLTTATTILTGQVKPRPPVKWICDYRGHQIDFLNVHLKCCDDGVDERSEASLAITDYLDIQETTQSVILLGDFNDEIDDTALEVFNLDQERYMFVDSGIANSPSSEWSYPGWPSHIDHILINQPLYDKIDTVNTLKLEACVAFYDRNISDHRPVIANFSF